MPIDPNLMARINQLIEKDPDPYEFPQQLTRGFTKGLTFGMAEPFKDVPPGGIPEHIAQAIGGGVGYMPLARGVGLGTAALGAAMPSLLRTGVTAGQAGSNMLSAARAIPESFNLAGRLATHGAASGAAAVLPDILGHEYRTPGEKVTNALLGTALGVMGEGLVSRLAHKTSTMDRALTPPAGPLTEAVGRDINVDRSGMIDYVQQRIRETEIRLSAPGITPRDAGKLSRQLKREKQYLTDLQTQVSRPSQPLDVNPLAEAGGEASYLSRSTPEAETAFRDAGGDWSQLQTPRPLAPLEEMGPPPSSISLESPGGTWPTQAQSKPFSTPVLNQGLPPNTEGLAPLIAKARETAFPYPAVDMATAPGEMRKIPQEIMDYVAVRSPQTAQKVLRDYVRRLTPEEQISELRRFGINGSALEPPDLQNSLVSTLEQAARGKKIPNLVDTSDYFRPDKPVIDITNPEFLRTRIRNVLGAAPAEVDTIRYNAAVQAIREGRAGSLPTDLDVIGRVLAESPFGSIRQIRIPPISGGSDAELVPNLMNNGFNKSTVVKALGRFGVIPATWLFGTQAGSIPSVMYQAEGVAAGVRRDVLQAVEPVFRWADSTKETVSRLFYQFAKRPREEFYAAIEREAPEAMPDIPALRDTLERMWMEYYRDGSLSVRQRITNYFPVVRDSYQASSGTATMIERGEEYFPAPLLNRLAAYSPDFAKRRTINSIDDYPRKISFDDTLRLYADQYARHVASRQALPDLQSALRSAPLDIQDMAAQTINTWLGKIRPGEASETTTNFGRFMRNFQFARTLGGSLLSPIVNTMQKLNTFAVVSPSSFIKAFDDVNDPAKIAILKKTPLFEMIRSKIDTLEKLGLEDAATSNPLVGAAQFAADKLGGLFSQSERNNRMHAFFAGLRDAEKRGLGNVDDQIKYAMDVVNSTQFIQSRANAIPILKSDPMRWIGQFQSFRINQVHFMTRLFDEAKAGAVAGDREGLARTLPFVKYWTVSALLAGGGLMGDFTEEATTRAVLGQSMHIPGIPEMLFGVSLSSQLGMGAINADDLRSMLFFLPGPSVGYAQGLVGTALGVDAGHGIDLSQIGRELSQQERVQLLVQSMPGGLALNRIFTALRLAENDGEFRRGMDIGEIIGAKPATGDLLSAKAASTSQVLMQAAGFPNSDRLQELRTIERQKEMMNDMMSTKYKAADLWASGQRAEAHEIINRFNRKYSDQLQTPLSGVDPKAIEAAYRRRILPPGKRVAPPKDLVGGEPFRQSWD